MARVDTSAYQSFDDIVGRLDEIVGTVRDKDTSLERSLDLFEEAISLGSKAVDMVDKVDLPAQDAAAEKPDKPVASVEADESGSDSDTSSDADADTGSDADAATGSDTSSSTAAESK